MKRFWDRAEAAPLPDGFAVMLDGKPVRLPGGAVLHVGRHALAVGIAAEWQQAPAEFGPDDVPLTGLAGAVQQRIAADRDATVASLARYAGSDLLCYRAEAPEVLARLQAERWQPWLDWAALALDAPLRVTAGVMFVGQDPGAVAALRRHVAACDDHVLAGLGVAVPATGSLVLGLALAAGRLDAAEAHALSLLDEQFQAEFWGQDAEAAARRARIAADLQAAERFMRLAAAED
jgi:chaperone required for assembly of F1-ATPase